MILIYYECGMGRLAVLAGDGVWEDICWDGLGLLL